MTYKKSLLYLQSDNKNLKSYFVPVTNIVIDLFLVNAESREDAINKANNGRDQHLIRQISLNEVLANEAYANKSVETDILFGRQIDHYELQTKDFNSLNTNIKKVN